ncbi:MAG: hypothetical protein WD025_04875 [Bacteriovoracaceae bacterium]
MKFLAALLLISSLISCGSLRQRNKERDLQSKMIRALNARTPQFAQCAKQHDLFALFGKDRVRVELVLDINARGQVENFQIDDKKYPNSFVDCMFEVADLIPFPRLNKNEMAQLTQPFIFSK